MTGQRLQQQVDELAQLLGLAAREETQDDRGARGSAGFPLELTARLGPQTAKQDPV